MKFLGIKFNTFLKINWRWFANECALDVHIFRFLSLASQAKVTWLYLLCWEWHLMFSSQSLWLQGMCVGSSSHVRRCAVDVCWAIQPCETLCSLSFAFLVPKFCQSQVLQDLIWFSEHRWSSPRSPGPWMISWPHAKTVYGWGSGPLPPPTLWDPPSGGWSLEKTCGILSVEIFLQEYSQDC